VFEWFKPLKQTQSAIRIRVSLIKYQGGGRRHNIREKIGQKQAKMFKYLSYVK